jgi:hypothetical protein
MQAGVVASKQILDFEQECREERVRLLQCQTRLSAPFARVTLQIRMKLLVDLRKEPLDRSAALRPDRDRENLP